jgi:hypothetical protein
MKIPNLNFFAIPICTHMHNVGHLNKLFHNSDHDLARLESHETLYMIGHFREWVSIIFAIVQVYYFLSQLGHIT